MQDRKQTFESMVENAIANLPNDIKEKALDADIILEHSAKPEHLLGSGLTKTEELLGISEMIPADENFGFDEFIPAKIIFFKSTIENTCQNSEEMVTVISDELQNHMLRLDES